jgi:hypothetical protein
MGARTYETMRSVTTSPSLREHAVASALANLIQGMSTPAAVAR